MVENRRSQNVENLDLPPVYELKCLENLLGGSQCMHCELIFSSKVELSAHLFPNKEVIKCPKCFSKFSTTRGMKQHFGKKHSKIRPYLCQICLKRFRSFYGARIHREQVHFKSARMNCNYCGKNVFNRYSLARHYKVCRNYSSD